MIFLGTNAIFDLDDGYSNSKPILEERYCSIACVLIKLKYGWFAIAILKELK